MPKLTGEDIASTNIISATYSNGKWFVLVSHKNNAIYNVSFGGSDIDDESTIASNTYTALLNVDAYVVVDEPKVSTNDKVIGMVPIRKG